MARSPLASLLVLAAAAFIVGQLSTFVPSPQQVARTEMQQAGRVPEVWTLKASVTICKDVPIMKLTEIVKETGETDIQN